MAKINKFIATYTDSIKTLDIPIHDSATPPKAVIHRFVRLLKDVDDTRLQGMVEYPLEEIILIAFLAVLGNASTWAEMEFFGKSNQRWLKKFLKLKHGIPSHDTFRRVFALIDTKQLQTATITFLMQNMHAIKKSLGITDSGYTLICVDGKEQRGTGRNYTNEDKISNLQTLHIYNASDEICLHSAAIDEKTNEIPVAQELLKTMNLKDCIITFDALHTQRNTVEIIKNQKGHYVGGLKGNQGALQQEASLYFDDECKNFYKEKGDFYETVEKAHGKIERRSYYLVKAHQSAEVKKWKGLKGFVCFVKKMEHIKTGKVNTEIRYYITSILDIELCAEAIRGHWGVENKLHWHLDYSFLEDDNTTMDKKAFNNYSLINKMVLSLCKLAKPIVGTPSIRILRKCFGWNYLEYIAQLLSCFDEETIKNAMQIQK
ncbi:MAG: ISAs1 family transposase [Eubacteriales bacterium]